MKICIINNIYPPYERGGAEQVVVRTVEGLRDAGHEVVVISSSPKGDEFEETENLKIYRTQPGNIFFYTKAHNHNVFSRFVWHVRDMFNGSVASWVQNILRQEQPDIVHTHNLMGLSFLIPRAIRKLNLPHIHTVHDVQLVEPSAMILKEKEHSFRYNGLHTMLYSALLRKLMGSPDVVISPSQFLKDFYKERGFFQKSTFEIVRNPMTFEISDSGIQKNNKKSGTTFNFLYLGQIEYHKGILLLVEAFVRAVQEYGIDATLHIVGDGSLFKSVRQASTGCENIAVYGRKDRKELPEFFQKMDMTIVPSLCYENSPTVIFESFAFAVPVLASNSEGIEELIEEGENGIMFEAANLESLTRKILWCVEHQTEIQNMSAKTVLSLKGLSQKEYISRLLELYSIPR